MEPVDPACPSEGAVEHFASQGFLRVPQLADRARVTALRAVAKEHLAADREPVEREADLGYPGAPSDLQAPGGRTIRRLLQAYDRHPVFRGWVHDPQLLAWLQRLLTTDRVNFSRAHHNCVMTKRPEYSSDTGWHQDVRYWRFSDKELITAWLALSDETPDNGGLWVLPGSHRWQVADGELDEARFLRVDRPRAQAAIDAAVPLQLQAGDVLFFHAALFHAASRNRTQRQKFSAVFTFHGPDTRPLAGSRSAALPEVELAAAPVPQDCP